MSDIWSYREEGDFGDMGTSVDVVGYGIEALDGSIGKIDEASYEADASYLVVDTGPWIFGRKVLLPAGVINGIDHETESVFVNRTKDEIKDSPPYDDTKHSEPDYHSEVGEYYGPAGRGYRDWDPLP